ncbi:MAG: hypothetical protein Q8M92_05115, partial [Candidatus Subteraquimicrobiales bacterium]|nr:hypothetical protein [Candidatus Subteraquimicrobiales bacterium]
SLGFQRLLPYERNMSVAGTRLAKGSVLKEIYRDELEIDGAGIGNNLMIDIEQYDAFRRPIQLLLEIYDERMVMIAKIWLRNASVAGTNINIGAGSQFSAEPAQISWENTECIL